MFVARGPVPRDGCMKCLFLFLRLEQPRAIVLPIVSLLFQLLKVPRIFDIHDMRRDDDDNLRVLNLRFGSF